MTIHSVHLLEQLVTLQPKELSADTLLYDGLHPNDEGYARMGNDLCEFLKAKIISMSILE